jgi:transcriptional regulator with XRE-family HTH domain
MKSRAAVALDRALEARGAQKKLAEAMGVDAAVPSRWRSGERKPDTRNRMWLDERMGIPWQWWEQRPVEEQKSEAIETSSPPPTEAA